MRFSDESNTEHEKKSGGAKRVVSISALEEKSTAIYTALDLVTRMEANAPIEHWIESKANILRAIREINEAFKESNQALVLALKGEIVGKP